MRGPVHVLRFRRGELRLDQPAIMGIVNVTPDSFLDGGKFFDPRLAIRHALRLVDEGAAVIDVGGESTRPGSDSVPEEEEWRRVEPVLKRLRPKTDAWISIDTHKPAIAEQALDIGVDLVNDVRGLRDARMIRVVASKGAAAVVMHMKGEPKDMQRNPSYDDVVEEVGRFLDERTREAIRGGVARESLIVDPGFGFGKTPDHNTKILLRLADIRALGFPVLAGTSGKRFGGKFGGIDLLEGRNGLTVTLLAVENGADLVRVHDVEAAAKAIRSAVAVERDE